MFHPIRLNSLESVLDTICLVVTNNKSGLIEAVIDAYVALYATEKHTPGEGISCGLQLFTNVIYHSIGVHFFILKLSVSYIYETGSLSSPCLQMS